MRGQGSIARLYKNQEHERKDINNMVLQLSTTLEVRDQQHEITGIET